MSMSELQLSIEVNKNLSEADFLTMVIGLAQYCKWRVAHFRAARTSKGWRTPVQGDAKGFLDLILVRRGQIMFAELKSQKGKVSPDQQQWIDALKETGNIVEIWRPSDWTAIVDMLK